MRYCLACLLFGFSLLIIGYCDSSCFKIGSNATFDASPSLSSSWKRSNLAHRRDPGGRHLWSNRFKFYSCLVAKCGTTNWLAHLNRMHMSDEQYAQYKAESDKAHRPPATDKSLQFYSRFTGNYKKSDGNSSVLEQMALRVLESPVYFKFAVVRHPWNRLISGYRNKIVSFCKLDSRCVSKNFDIKRMDKENTSITLDIFLIKLLEMNPISINKHFQPTTLACDMENIRYDFVGDIENRDDMAFILGKIKSPSLVLESTHRIYDASQYSTIPCSVTTVLLAERLYANDLQAYGCTMAEAYKSCKTYGFYPPPEQ